MHHNQLHCDTGEFPYLQIMYQWFHVFAVTSGLPTPCCYLLEVRRATQSPFWVPQRLRISTHNYSWPQNGHFQLKNVKMLIKKRKWHFNAHKRYYAGWRSTEAPLLAPLHLWLPSPQLQRIHAAGIGIHLYLQFPLSMEDYGMELHMPVQWLQCWIRTRIKSSSAMKLSGWP